MAKGTKRSAANGAKAENKKKFKAQPQPVPEQETTFDENEATIYESAEEGVSSQSENESGSGDDLDELDDLDDLDNTEDKSKSVSPEDSSDESDLLDKSSDESAEEEENSDKEDSPADPNKKTSAEQHAEQRKLLAERKLKRKSGIEVQRIKSLWERLRVKQPAPPKQVRDKLCDEIWELSQDVIYDLVLKHDASRVVQTLVKYSSEDRREKIVDALKGNYYNLSTSSYGKYLLVKLLHYGSKKLRLVIVDELHGKLRKLMRHKEGAYVVEDLYVLYSTPEQKKQMIREFWGSEYAVFKDAGKGKSVLEIANESAEKKQLIMANLNGTITASVAKGSTGFQILHAALKDYISILVEDPEKFKSQINELIELLAEQVAELVHTKDGSEVASTLIALSGAKQRKVIIRSLKPHAQELIKNEFGNTVLIVLYMTVDDTVLLLKTFNEEYLTPEVLPELIQDKSARKPFLYLLQGLSKKYFAPKAQAELLGYEKLAYALTTKKAQEKRHEELKNGALPLIYKGLLESETPLFQLMALNIAAQFVTDLILTTTADADVNSQLRPQLVNAIFELAFNGDILEDHHLLNKTPFFARLVKALIHGNEFKFDHESKALTRSAEAAIPSIGTEFAQRAADTLLNDASLENWVSGQGAFTVVAVLEALQLTDDKRAKALRKALKKLLGQLKSDTDSKGAQLLAKLL